MKKLSYFFIIAFLACFSCSDDEEAPVRGTLVVDGESFDLHKLYGQAEVGSDYSYYSFTILNSKGKMSSQEDLKGKGINGMRFEFYRQVASNEPPTGTFYNDDSEEHYEIDHIDAVLGYDASDENSGLFLDDYDYAEVVVTKSGSKYKFIFEGVTDTGLEVTMTYEGPLKELEVLDAMPLK